MAPFLGTLKIRCRIIIGIKKGTIILTTTHMELHGLFPGFFGQGRSICDNANYGDSRFVRRF